MIDKNKTERKELLEKLDDYTITLAGTLLDTLKAYRAERIKLKNR